MFTNRAVFYCVFLERNAIQQKTKVLYFAYELIAG